MADMLESVRRWLSPSSTSPGWGGLPAWARERNWQFKPTHSPRGFVLVDPARLPDGRIEWGPSHRDYLGIYELRVRAATGSNPSLQAALMPLEQMTSIAKASAMSSEESGNAMAPRRTGVKEPEEVPWLSCLQKPTPQAMGRLATLYGAVSSDLSWLHAWLASDLTDALYQWGEGSRAAPGTATPMVLMTQKSTLVLRVAMPQPDATSVQRALALFDVALAVARRLASDPSDAPELPEPAVRPGIRRAPPVRR